MRTHQRLIATAAMARAPMPINTIHQLYAHKKNKPELVNQTCCLLTLPNLFIR